MQRTIAKQTVRTKTCLLLLSGLPIFFASALPLLRFQRTVPVSLLVSSLIANTYGVIDCSQVARGFRPSF